MKKEQSKAFPLFFCLLAFVLIPQRLHAQEMSRVFTLDETLGILAVAGNGAKEEFRWDPFFREGAFSVGGHYGAFSAALSPGETGFLMLDNRDFYPVAQPYLDKGELVFPRLFVDTAKEAFARTIGQDDSHYRIAAIIIDPGHGGTDSGAIGELTVNGKTQKVYEKDVDLKAAKILRDMLAKAYPDKRILMTREKDITCSLEARTVIANSVPIRKNEAIIYISVHANASRDTKARGYEVWHLKPEYQRNCSRQYISYILF